MSEPRPNNSMSTESAEDFNPSMRAPGAQLAAMREARGWTVEQVASHLNLAPRQVRAIESDDYAALPGMAITRGFMRSYAKLLQIDPGPLLASISGETVIVSEPTAMRKAVPTTFSESHLPLRSDNRGSKARKLVAGLLVVALGIGAWAVQHQGGFRFLSGVLPAHSDDKEAPREPVDTSRRSDQSSDSASSGNVQSSSGAETATSAATAGATSQAAGADQSQTTPAVDTSTATKPPAPATPAAPVKSETTLAPLSATSGTSSVQESAAPAAAAAVKKPDPAGANALILNIREESWLEIRRANKVLVARLAKAGETETIDMSGPVTLLLGNAHGVDAMLRGKPVQILANRKNNTARLTFE